MAELDELDRLLHDSLARIAELGTSAGVADAIRSRVDAGDLGTPAAASTAPGWSGGALSWMPWVGLVVVAGLVGGALGPLGAFGSETTEVLAPPSHSGALDREAIAYLCVDGSEAGHFTAGERVYAIERSEDGSWLGVRDPYDVRNLLWIPGIAVALDEGESAADLPLGGECPHVETELWEPAPEPGPGPQPQPGPGPQPAPSDTTPPSIQQAGGNPNPLYNLDPLLLAVVAADDVGVASVRVTWSGEFSGGADMSFSGGQWRHTFTPPDDGGGVITFTFRAKDAAGNTSAPVSIDIDHQYFG